MSEEEQAKALREELVGVARSDYGGDYLEHAVEQYQLYVESAERISDRRQSANSFFLSTNTLLLGAQGVIFQLRDSFGFVMVLISLAGIILSYTWYSLILSYKAMNTGKFAVIHEIEKQLPFRLYHAEWQVLEEGVKQGNYIKFTVLEKQVPWVFLAMHVIVIGFAGARVAGLI